MNPTTKHATSPVPFLALGDSYIIGESVDPSERWPVRLAQQLRESGINIADPHIIATTGWTTDELAAGIEQANISETYGFVTLLIGVNNQYRGFGLEEYRTEFRQLLQQAIVFADGKPERVMVLSIPDWGVTPFAAMRNTAQIGEEISRFNAVNMAESERTGVVYVDITPISKLAKNDETLLAKDQLHPSGKMYQLWVDLALPLAREMLRSEDTIPHTGTN